MLVAAMMGLCRDLLAWTTAVWLAYKACKGIVAWAAELWPHRGVRGANVSLLDPGD